MAEYIDREEVINLLLFFGDESCCSIVSDVENLPAADVVPVQHGRWLTWAEKFPDKKIFRNPTLSTIGVFCSRCGNHADNMSDYCPNCGAKMDGGDADAAENG